MVGDDFAKSYVEPYIGDVLAFRTFRIEGLGTENPALAGVTFRQPVVPGVNQAQCPSGKHEAPDEDCTCGWYAYDEQRWWDRRRSAAATVPRGSATAIVRLSGKVVVCERGLKAQYLEVVALASAAENSAVLKSIHPTADIFVNEAEMLAKYPLARLDRGPKESAWQKMKASAPGTLRSALKAGWLPALKLAGVITLLYVFMVLVQDLLVGPWQALPLLTLIVISPVTKTNVNLFTISLWVLSVIYAVEGVWPWLETNLTPDELGTAATWTLVVLIAVVSSYILALHQRMQQKAAAWRLVGVVVPARSSPQRRLPMKLKDPNPPEEGKDNG